MLALATARLTLEPQLPAHAEAMFEVLADPALYTHLDYPPPPSVAHLRAVYERQQARRSPDGRQHWLNWIVRPHAQAPIGYVQATVEADASAWVAYVLSSRCWGRGYAREATEAMLEHLRARYGARRFLATVEAQNARSIGLLRRLDFDEVAPGDPLSARLSATELAFARPAQR